MEIKSFEVSLDVEDFIFKISVGEIDIGIYRMSIENFFEMGTLVFLGRLADLVKLVRVLEGI